MPLTTIDIANAAVNVIPNSAKAQFNVRFNDTYTPDSLKAEIQRRLENAGENFDIEMRASGESFLTPPGKLSDVMRAAVTKITGLTPELSTSGGTSDARFIKDHCAVAEFGLLNQTAHKVDEHIATDDILKLTEIYYEMIKGFFAGQE